MALLLLMPSTMGFTKYTNKPLNEIQEDRQRVSSEVGDALFHSDEYKDLLQKLEEIDTKYSKERNKKSAAKMLGYTSGGLGIISSIWAMYEKTLSLKNSKIELVIRTDIKNRILVEIQTLKDAKCDPYLLSKKIENLAEVEEKLTNINMRIRISKMGFYRGVFKGVTSTGVFIMTIFIDEISDFLYDKSTSVKQKYKDFLYTWRSNHQYSSIVRIAQEDKETASLLFFLENDEEWDNALLLFKKQYPNDYARFVKMAKQKTINDSKLDLNHHVKKLFDIEAEQWYTEYYRCVPDGTKVNNIHGKEFKTNY